MSRIAGLVVALSLTVPFLAAAQTVPIAKPDQRALSVALVNGENVRGSGR